MCIRDRGGRPADARRGRPGACGGQDHRYRHRPRPQGPAVGLAQCGRLAYRAGACHTRRRVDRRRARARLRGDVPMRLGSDHVRVRVPATSANLGPGFDSMGIALAHYDTIEIRALGSPEVTVEVFGEGAGELPTGEDHLIAVSYTHLR